MVHPGLRARLRLLLLALLGLIPVLSRHLALALLLGFEHAPRLCRTGRAANPDRPTATCPRHLQMERRWGGRVFRRAGDRGVGGRRPRRVASWFESRLLTPCTSASVSVAQVRLPPSHSRRDAPKESVDPSPRTAVVAERMSSASSAAQQPGSPGGDRPTPWYSQL